MLIEDILSEIFIYTTSAKLITYRVCLRRAIKRNV
jgi:hypothetical protein